MRKRYIRLDDSCPKRDIRKWDKIEKMLDYYNVKPLVGIIPDCQDSDFEQYQEDKEYWSKKINEYKEKGWILAMHGYQHIFHTKNGGINPVNPRSEFAGVPIEEQRKMIKNAVSILKRHGIEATVFFAPAHTFDKNTLEALIYESNIRIISDTPATDSYESENFTFIPQQSGKVRWLPFKTITFCYHPNKMRDKDFIELEKYLKKGYINNFEITYSNRRLNLIDRILMKLYYLRHK